MAQFTIKDRLGEVSIAEMRRIFEAIVNTTPVFKRDFSLVPVMDGEKFAGYKDDTTDTVWVGFAIGTRNADRILKAAGLKRGLPIASVATPSVPTGGDGGHLSGEQVADGQASAPIPQRESA